MKTLLTYLVCFLWTLAPFAGLRAASVASFLSGGVATASSVLKDSNTAANNGSTTFGNGGNLKYCGGGFVAGSSYTLTSVDVYLAKLGSPSFTISCEIWSQSGTDPSAKISTGTSNSFNATSDLTTSEAAYTFTGMTASITSGTTYYIMLICSSTADVSNNVLWYRNSASANQIDTSPDGTTWSTQSSTRRCKFATYGY